MKKRVSKLSKAAQEKIELEYHQTNPAEFDEQMSKVKKQIADSQETKRRRAEKPLPRKRLSDPRREKNPPLPRMSKHVVSYFDLLGMERVPVDDDDDAEGEIGDALIFGGVLQVQLSIRGWFVRGAVCIGDLYMDEDMVFGPALVEAYTLERCMARDARVVLSEACMRAVERHTLYYARQRESHRPKT